MVEQPAPAPENPAGSWMPGLIGASVAGHALIALLFCAVIAGADAIMTATVRLVIVAVGQTGLVVLGVALMSRPLGPNHMARRLAWIFSLAPWLLGTTAAPWLAPPTPEGWPTDLLSGVVASLGLAGMLTAQVVRRTFPLRSARRLRQSGIRAEVRDIPGRSLASNFGRLLTGLVGVSVVISAGIVGIQRPGGLAGIDLSDPGLPIVLVSFLGSLFLAAFAGVSVGRSPGRDVRSIARRLDALGYEASEVMNWPVAVTSFDDLGRLFQELENLRRRLFAELKRYQDALDRTRDADTAKANFLAAVSHELRTPLNSIEGYAQLLLEGTPDPMTEPQREDVRLIRTGARQLLGLINDILDISMIESGELSLSFEEHDLGALIRELVDINQPLVMVDDKTLVADCPPDLPRVVCDRRRVGQILNNLVSNAIKFTEVGSITVRAAYDEAEGAVLIRVIDTGVGIAPDELGTIFEEFRQVGELKRRVKGTGLGLAIARSIAQAHGGDLRATSELGVGSTFTLSLPLNPVKTPEKIDVTEARVRAAARVQQRSGQVQRFSDGVPAMTDPSFDLSSDSLVDSLTASASDSLTDLEEEPP